MRVLSVFLAGAGVASFNVLLDEGPHGGPPVLSLDAFKGGVDAWMARGRVVVALLKYVASELVVVWNVDFAFVEYKAVFFFPFGESVDEFAGSGLEGCEGGENVGFLFTGLSDAIFEWVGEFVGGGKFGE